MFISQDWYDIFKKFFHRNQLYNVRYQTRPKNKFSKFYENRQLRFLHRQYLTLRQQISVNMEYVKGADPL